MAMVERGSPRWTVSLMTMDNRSASTMSLLHTLYVSSKSVTLCLRKKTFHFVYCPFLCQILTDFKNSFTGTLARQFAIK